MSKKIITPLPKITIDAIFASAHHQADYVIGLYRQAVPDWDKVEHVNGYPQIGKSTADYIFMKAIEFDKRVHRDVLAGGCWMNNGFSVSNDITDWTVEVESDIVKYKEA